MANESGEVYLILNVPSVSNMNITVGNETYHVQTEHGGIKNPLLTTLIYHKGKIVYSKKTDYSHLLNIENHSGKLRDMMEVQHKVAVADFTRKLEETKKKTDYFDAVKKLLRRGNNKQALKILEDGLKEFPEDPFIMSYYGCLTAAVEKKIAEGIKICQEALEKLNPSALPGEESLYASFYLNLGRAYLAGGQRKPAIDAFNNGLNIDKTNHDLLWELKKLGTRKKSAIPFFPRSSSVNKYIGLMLSKLKRK